MITIENEKCENEKFYDWVLFHKQLIRVWKKIMSEVLYLDAEDVDSFMSFCRTHNVNFQRDYAKKLNIAYNYCKSRHHHKTGRNMLDYVFKKGQKIYIDSYEAN